MSKTPKPAPPVQVDDDDEDEDEDDPVDAMIKKTGCIELHHELQVKIVQCPDFPKSFFGSCQA